MTKIRDQLKATLDEAEWEWLLPHHERGALIVVSHELDLLEVGEKIALDAKSVVEDWLKRGLLRRPTPAQLELWQKNPKKRFLSLIAQPWVLIQEHLMH